MTTLKPYQDWLHRKPTDHVVRGHLLAHRYETARRLEEQDRPLTLGLVAVINPSWSEPVYHETHQFDADLAIVRAEAERALRHWLLRTNEEVEHDGRVYKLDSTGQLRVVYLGDNQCL